MPISLTEKQSLLLRGAAMALAVYVVFQYLIPLVLPFLIAGLLAMLLRPAAAFLKETLKIPVGIGAVLVLGGIVAVIGVLLFFLGRVTVEQLLRLWENLPQLWDRAGHWLWNCCESMEESLDLEQGTIARQLTRITGSTIGGDFVGTGSGIKESRGNVPMDWLADQLGTVLGTSLQGAISVVRVAISTIVTVFITIGATLVTTTQLEELKRSLDHSPFRQEIRRVFRILARVGRAYGKTQVVIMVCTVAVSALGLSLLGDPYALLWAAVIGLVDALPLFGAGAILWPWIVLSALRGQWMRAVGLAVIYAVSNLLRQWLEARYMGERIGLTALENLIAMYLGLKLFGLLGLFWGPIGYLLIKEALGSSGKRRCQEL